MKIIVDSHIPHIQGIIEPRAEVLYLEPEDITRDAVSDADALIIRTRTRCHAALLDGSRVRFIGSATIGTDHIDLDYCAARGITVCNAPGCNAPAVAQWVFCAINAWMQARGITTADGLSLGIVGVGHIGSIVARWAGQLGFTVLLNDPPREMAEKTEGTEKTADGAHAKAQSREGLFWAAANAERTERTADGAHAKAQRREGLFWAAANAGGTGETEKTADGAHAKAQRREELFWAAANAERTERTERTENTGGTDGGFLPLEELQRRCDIITFHTPITRDGQWPTWHLCDQAFLDALDHCRLILDAARGPIVDNEALLRWHGDVALDCWENEPDISRELLEKAIVATPHIAGYSSQGKQRGTAMMLAALNEFYGWDIPVPVIEAPATGAVDVTLAGIAASYDILADTARLKAAPATFESLRNHYAHRPEYQ